MKIAFLTFEYPPFIVGGAGVYAYNLTNELSRLGHEVHVIMPDHFIENNEAISKDIVIHKLKFINKPFLAAPSFWHSLRKEFPSLRRQVKDFDVVHINGLCDLSLTKDLVPYPRILCIHHLIKTVVKAFNLNFFERIKNIREESGMMSFLEHLSIKRADHIVTVSQFTRQSILINYKFPENKVDVIYHGVRPEDYLFTEEEKNKFRNTLGINSQLTILFVGRLERRKGVYILLKAMARVTGHVDARLILAGSGSQAIYCELARSLNISDKVTFLGYVPDNTLRLLYSICSVFVFPSRMEGFGIAPLEAMAAGKPVISSRVGGLPEFVKEGENGFLVEPEDIQGLAEAIIKILRDDSLIKTIGENNLKKVKTSYTWPLAAQKMEYLYNKLIGK